MDLILASMCAYMSVNVSAGTRVGMYRSIHVDICTGPFGRTSNKSQAVAALEREHGISLSEIKPGGLTAATQT